MRNHTVVVQQGVHMVEALVSGEVGMVPPIRIVCVVVWGIGW